MSFDVARCISLHNTVVSRAIAQLSEDLQLTIIRNWFTAYNVKASNPGLPVQLTVPLKEFLSGIDIVKPRSHGRRVAFTPFLDMVRLYRNNGEDPGGLVMYLDEHTVSFLETSEDEPGGVGYGPFEGTLRRHLSYIDAGKFFVDTSPQLGSWGDTMSIQGWRYQGYIPFEMENTLDLWNQVVDSIASRMPGSPTTETDEVLIPLFVLDRYQPIPLFAREFLSRARKHDCPRASGSR
ncbi:hypothetical protein BU25DRAFT_481532 [Macroventuria anomochaeta]|uniref:Uncharacterized protein n=1 Tax=Macroventuria anomochaeta TaxID=301207 RepID=A0ACB6SAB0_9PLEO|nr:uncharacterized protein BU25DRAFT_481532 [Macroventuria anomochaeta]KAF2631061.1 hypothetical protein BU25DRAFT_481532 [Macroventuria anomochaeta]